VECGALAVVRAWEPLWESYPTEKCLNRLLDGARQRRGNLPHKKNNVSGDDEVGGGEIKTPVTFVVSGVFEKIKYIWWTGMPVCERL
jgi:hypothetical protein